MPAAGGLPVGPSFPTKGNGTWQATADQAERWGDAFPNVDIIASLKPMAAWCHANPAKLKTARGMERFVFAWLSRETGRTKPKPLDLGSEPFSQEQLDVIAKANADKLAGIL